MFGQCCVCGDVSVRPVVQVEVDAGKYHRRYSNHLCSRDFDILDTMLSMMSRVAPRRSKVRQLRLKAPLGS